MPADTTNRHFGLVIAYLLPGFVALAGFAPLSPTVGRWLSAAQTAGIDASLFAVMAATAAGMIVSCFRWLIVDRVHALTGLGAAAFNARALEERPAALTYLVENHYRYYQFYANTLVATAWAYAVHRALGTSPSLDIGTDVGVIVLCAALFAGSRDALAKYRSRSIQLVGHTFFSNPRGEPMTNGIDHNGGAGGHPQPPKPQGKPHQTPAAPARPQQPQTRREPGAK